MTLPAVTLAAAFAGSICSALTGSIRSVPPRPTSLPCYRLRSPRFSRSAEHPSRHYPLLKRSPRKGWRLAFCRAHLRQQFDFLFPSSPAVSGILRAMLLGDRAFVNRADPSIIEKPKSSMFSFVAGLHVGALGTFLIVLAFFAYIVVVEQRAPVLRAGLMALFVLLGSFFYRRLELLNHAASRTAACGSFVQTTTKESCRSATTVTT